MHMSQVFYQSRGIIGHASNTSPCDFEDALGHYTFLWLKTNMVSANKTLPILAVHSGPKLIFLPSIHFTAKKHGWLIVGFP